MKAFEPMLALAREHRWRAADVVASLMSTGGGLTVRKKSRCPHCAFALFYMHNAPDALGWFIHECLRCGATYLDADLWRDLA
jgi:hypothetical protein